jgi:hypothetical protein
VPSKIMKRYALTMEKYTHMMDGLHVHLSYALCTTMIEAPNTSLNELMSPCLTALLLWCRSSSCGRSSWWSATDTLCLCFVALCFCWLPGSTWMAWI